jgi:hypothetical protein
VHLIDYYTRRGYLVVDLAQWAGKTYRSVIMSKRLKWATSDPAHLLLPLPPVRLCVPLPTVSMMRATA